MVLHHASLVSLGLHLFKKGTPTPPHPWVTQLPELCRSRLLLQSRAPMDYKRSTAFLTRPRRIRFNAATSNRTYWGHTPSDSQHQPVYEHWRPVFLYPVTAVPSVSLARIHSRSVSFWTSVMCHMETLQAFHVRTSSLRVGMS